MRHTEFVVVQQRICGWYCNIMQSLHNAEVAFGILRALLYDCLFLTILSLFVRSHILWAKGGRRL